MTDTQMNLKRGPFAYRDYLSQAPQLKKDDLHSRISAAFNEYLNTDKLCRPTPNEPVKVADNVPLPGFEGSCSSSSINKKRIPIASLDPDYIPPKFSLNPNWLVAAGEDSQECASQRNRESKVQEAIYRHGSSIPLNPSVSLEVQHEDYDDSLTPIIPIIPIEEVEMAHSSPHILEKQPIHSSAKFPNSQCCVNNKAAADKKMNKPCGGTDSIAAALTFLLKSGELGNMIDTNLLLKILSDPKLIAALLSAINSASPPKSCAAAEAPPQKKEEDYYKELIRQHGADNIIMTEKINTTTTTSSHLNNNDNNNKVQKVNIIKDNKSKKRCRFFNSKSGCRNGVSCLFLHEVSQPLPSNAMISPVVEQEHSAKRLRVC